MVKTKDRRGEKVRGQKARRKGKDKEKTQKRNNDKGKQSDRRIGDLG